MKKIKKISILNSKLFLGIFMKKIFTVFAISFFIFSANALPFNSKLSQSDLENLSGGSVLIRNIKNEKNISLESDQEVVKRLKSLISEVKPNYSAEIIQIRPVNENPNLILKMKEALENIPDYVGIPYVASSGTIYDLYSKADIISTKKISETATEYQVELLMEPFSQINATITIEQTEDYVFYSMVNTNKIKVKGFNAVNPEKMANSVILFKDGENWILYGIGGVRSYKVPFMEKKIENSFMNRIKTFCNFIFKKI